MRVSLLLWVKTSLTCYNVLYFTFTIILAAAERKFFVGGNWKCNGSKSQIHDIVGVLNAGSIDENVEVVIAPSQVHLASVRDNLRGDIGVSSQDIWSKGAGAYTGETNAAMVKVYSIYVCVLSLSLYLSKPRSLSLPFSASHYLSQDIGCEYTLVGHSERRAKGESDVECGEKAKFALDNGLDVIACCGETLEERESGNTQAVVNKQSRSLLTLPISRFLTGARW